MTSMTGTSHTPTATQATALLRGLLIDTSRRLNRESLPGRVIDYRRDPMGDALVALLLDDNGPETTLLAAAMYAVHLAPGMAGYLAERIDAVASRADDAERGYRVEEDGSHDRLCSHAVGCDACDQWHRDHLDDAVRELVFLLGDKAVADLHAHVSASA